MRRKNTTYIVITIAVYFFILAPLLMILLTSFSDTSYIAFPPVGFTLKWYEAVFRNENFMNSFRLSLLIATSSTLLAMVVGIPGAYALNRYQFRYKHLIKDLFLAPNLVPNIVMGFALFLFLIVRLRLNIRFALLVGLAVSVITYTFRIVGAGIVHLDVAIEEAGMSLGASRLVVFFKIVLPNISSSMISAFLLAFISAFNNVPLTIFLTSPGVVTLPVTMMSFIEYNYDPTISALSVLLMFMSLLIMFLSNRLIQAS